MSIKYTDNVKDYERLLKKVHGGLANASSQTVNEAADILENRYKSEIKGKKIPHRNKFTMGAVKKYYSKPKNTKGDFRPIEKINAIVGVMKMKGGKEHYLKDQEEGATHRGNPKTQYKVAFALDQARTGSSRRKVIKGALQLQRSSSLQTLRFPDGKNLGKMSDGFMPKQRWAILYKYTGLSGRGDKAKNNRLVGHYGWDLKRPFYFTGLVRGLGIFQAIGKRIKMIRQLNKTSVSVKATGKFEKSFQAVDKNKLIDMMTKNAKRIAGVK
jgi:hypothetical protein